MPTRESDRGATVIGVVGLGYVGLPFAVEAAAAGYRTVGFDVAERVVSGVNAGHSHIQDVPSATLGAHVAAGRIEATADMGRLAECDAIAICVPTPLNKVRDPDLAYVVAAAESVRDALRAGQLVILESTTFPGTTRETLLPILEGSGLRAGADFHVCYSPERVDPGNREWHTRNTPKVLGGLTDACTEAGLALYSTIFDTVVPVSSVDAAELVKVYENTFRMINIALVNELAQVADRLGVDVWEVIDAAATKPFGFMKFSPGPGLGGHCVPLDPHYLSWKMRTLAYKTRMIELASEINAEMPAFVVHKAAEALNDEGKAVRGRRVLVLGVAYKRDIDDLRESPAIEIIELLQRRGADVAYHDPHCPEIAEDGKTGIGGLPMRSVALDRAELERTDLVVIVTDHTAVDYDLVLDAASLVVDARGALRGRSGNARIVPLAGAAVPGAVSAGAFAGS